MRDKTLSAVLTALALAGPVVAHGAPNLNINGLTIETGTGKTLGTLSSQGGMDEFTKLQKELVLTVIKQLGIDLETLPPAVRGQIEKPQTSNPQALQAFAKGLDLADKGQFKDAAAAFKEAARHDPGFGLAAGMARLMPNVNVGAGGGGNELRAMRRTAREEGQRHADRQLQRMNQGGGRMKDLGLSDGRGGKDKEARMDPVELADDLTDGSGGNPGNGNGEQNLLALNQVPNNQEDTQRRDIEEVIPDSGGGEPLPEDYQGFSAGIFEWCPDGCLAQEIMVEGSSDSVLLHFRPSEFQVDAALNLFGDMLFGNSEPGTAFSLTSACSISDEGCSYYTEEVGVYSEYLDKNNFAVFLDDWNNGVFRSFWTSELETDSSQFDYSAWGYWYDFNGDTGEYFEGYWVAGQLTPAANIPASGSAAYTGGVVGITENFAYLEGSMNWTVNFASRTVSGTFDNLVYAGTDSVWLSQVDANGGWSAGSNAVSATLSGANVVSGTAKGAFYGPNAEELGGAWQIKKSSGDGYENAAGIFLSKPGGTAFYDCNARGCYGRQSAR